MSEAYPQQEREFNEIVIHNDAPPPPAVQQFGQLPVSVDEKERQREILKEHIRRLMKQGIHWDFFYGSSEPAWLKPGAELLLNIYQIGPTFKVNNQSADGEVTYEVEAKAVHLPTSRVVGQGLGVCTSLEEKYAWRQAVCPEEFEYYPEAKRRVKFKEKWENRQRTGYYQLKQVRQDPQSQAHTILKMAKKRALVDLANNVCAVSDILQEFKDTHTPQKKGTGKRNGQSHAPQHSHRPQYPEETQGAPAGELTPGMLATINRELEKAGIEVIPDLLAEFKVATVKDLPAAKVNDVLEWIKGRS